MFFLSMTSYFVTDGLGPTNARSTSYAYTYESHYDQPPILESQQQQSSTRLDDHYESSDANYARAYATIDDNTNANSLREIERQSTQTQKVLVSFCDDKFILF